MSHAFLTKAFDASLIDALRAGARQVVVLGAGFASRGYRFQQQLRGVRFIEVDSPPTQWRSFRRRATPNGIRLLDVSSTSTALGNMLATGSTESANILGRTG